MIWSPKGSHSPENDISYSSLGVESTCQWILREDGVQPLSNITRTRVWSANKCLEDVFGQGRSELSIYSVERATCLTWLLHRYPPLWAPGFPRILLSLAS